MVRAFYCLTAEQSFLEFFVEVALHAVLAFVAAVEFAVVEGLAADECVVVELARAGDHFAVVDDCEHVETVYFQNHRVLYVHHMENYIVYFAQHCWIHVIENR